MDSYDQGYAAALDGKGEDANPYHEDQDSDEWIDGWVAGRADGLSTD